MAAGGSQDEITVLHLCEGTFSFDGQQSQRVTIPPESVRRSSLLQGLLDSPDGRLDVHVPPAALQLWVRSTMARQPGSESDLCTGDAHAGRTSYTDQDTNGPSAAGPSGNESGSMQLSVHDIIRLIMVPPPRSCPAA